MGGVLNDSDRLLAKKLNSISAEKMVVNCARLHQKLSDAVTQFNYCYSTLVSLSHLFFQTQNAQD